MDTVTSRPSPTDVAAVKVWRYMSFARFVWMLQKRQLWLSRADLLGDPWEIALVGNQLKFVISHHPPIDIFLKEPRQSAEERSARVIKLWRRKTFVNCWSMSEHESHALWRIYCRSVEGVALQTTLTRLRDSVPGLRVLQVTYDGPGLTGQTPTIDDLVTKKRPMFVYEHEVRIVRCEIDDAVMPDEKILGLPLAWWPEHHLVRVCVHPEADSSFFETVTAVIEQYAPALRDCLEWSAMKDEPPF